MEQTDIRKLIGLRVRDLRTSLSISQEELAHLSGLDRTYVNSIENGHRNVSIVNITKIARALGIPSGTVRSRLHIARQRLRELLAQEEKEQVSESKGVAA